LKLAEKASNKKKVGLKGGKRPGGPPTQFAKRGRWLGRLVHRIFKKRGQTGLGRTWSSGEKGQSLEQEESKKAVLKKRRG